MEIDLAMVFVPLAPSYVQKSQARQNINISELDQLMHAVVNVAHRNIRSDWGLRQMFLADSLVAIGKPSDSPKYPQRKRDSFLFGVGSNTA